MIVNYKVSGYKSIQKKLCLDLQARKSQRIQNTIYENNYFLDERIVKSVVLFGANATGKTNTFESIKVLRNIILNGLDIKNSSNYINSDLKYISYEITLLLEKDIYFYTLTFNKEKIMKKSLK